MTGRIRESRGARSAFVAAALLVLLVRMLVPAGYMPVAADGRIVVQMCSGHDGPASIVVDLGKTAPDPADHHKATDGLCTFAGGFAGGMLPFELPKLALPLAAEVELVAGAAIADLTVHRLAAPPPPAIGPPLSA
jgi:hypothetical protein